MNFTELVQAAIDLTKRPDLLSKTEAAVRASTRKAHGSDMFYKDIHETGVQFDAARYIQNFLPTEIYPRFRKVKYLRNWNYGQTGISPSDIYGGLGGPGDIIKFIDASQILDRYGYTKTNVCYMAGQLLQLRTTCAIQYVLFGAYLYPDVGTASDTTTYSSWIAESYPEAIYYDAARSIFMGIGFQEQASSMASLTAEAYRLLTIDSIDMAGE